MQNCVLAGLDFTGLCFARAHFLGCHFTRADLTDADFQRARLFGSNFESADLTRANFERADLRAVVFDRAVLDQTRFDEADLRRGGLISRGGAAAGGVFPEIRPSSEERRVGKKGLRSVST